MDGAPKEFYWSQDIYASLNLSLFSCYLGPEIGSRPLNWWTLEPGSEHHFKKEQSTQNPKRLLWGTLKVFLKPVMWLIFAAGLSCCFWVLRLPAVCRPWKKTKLLVSLCRKELKNVDFVIIAVVQCLFLTHLLSHWELHLEGEMGHSDHKITGKQPP